ncbi:FAD-dependent oxidoreductase [Microbispora rosea subsp. aerata]|nr:FAD-dependent monooxygenase [Microbispora rosea]GGO16210.1 FAD-dependent oxidoreductase [Microbispora rosea subsp. aerata]GIH55876.1 FAD-dependent oxidoreductase [Microbispora rosea subsp. aerata]GLJ83210.1 FAD-dependent oxidoreductase [Microbispora rosea subsp. aerata]
MTTRSVLISGASIAGPAVAYWLRRHGFTPTVVERAPALREGGQAVDFRGAVHMHVLRRMGVLDEIRRLRTDPGPWRVVDSRGDQIVALPAEFAGGEVEIPRGGLARVLYDLTRHDVEYVFGDSIASMTETPHGVEVTFERGAPRTFDLVIGADGLHSNVRRLAFGPESRFVRPSGHHVAIFSAPDHLGLGRDTLLYNEPGLGVAVSGAGDGATAAVMCVFYAPWLEFDHRDVPQQKKIVLDAYAGAGWETSRLLRAVPDASDFYFDSISLVRMDRYTTGRIALLGDAGYGATCGGMGAGMAVVAAYVLAGEIAAAGGDHRAAFPEYERVIRGFVKACQRVAGNAGSFLAPTTRRAIRRRNLAYRVLTTGPLMGVLDRMTTKAATSITLKDYAA